MCYCGNDEPTLKELLEDPIAELLRRRDRITLRAVRAAMAEAQGRLRVRLAVAPRFPPWAA